MNENNVITPSPAPTSSSSTTTTTSTSSVTPDPTPEPKSGKTMKMLMAVLALVLIAGAGAGGYLYGNSKNNTATVPPTKTDTTTTTPASNGVHFVVATARPSNTAASDFTYTTKLGLPSFLQGVNLDSTPQDPADIFTTILNNEMGSWAISDPTSPYGDNSEVAMFAISDNWLASNGKEDNSISAYTGGNALMTVADKKKFMTDTIADTTACAKDASKGFKTNDGTLNVCYTYMYGKEGYGPEVVLTGYGNVKDQPVVLVGVISIYDTTDFATHADALKAIADAEAGHPTAITAKAQKAILDALKQTTITTATAPKVTAQ